jgi:hypothetical protein
VTKVGAALGDAVGPEDGTEIGMEEGNSKETGDPEGVLDGS